MAIRRAERGLAELAMANHTRACAQKKQRGEVPSKLPAFLTALFKFCDFQVPVFRHQAQNRASRVIAPHPTDFLPDHSRRVSTIGGAFRVISHPCTLCKKAARQGPLKASSFPYRAAEFSFPRLTPGPGLSANRSSVPPGTLKHRSHTDGVKTKLSKWGK